MAEAPVEENLAEPPSSKFFCHKCKVELSIILNDFTCPRCLGGFIEELLPTTPGTDDADDSSDDDDDDMGDDDHDDMGDDLHMHMYAHVFGQVAERDRGAGTLRRGTGGPVPAGFRRGRGTGGCAMPTARGTHGHGRGGGGPVPFSIGNLGDYAWGRDGLDAIVTQFLNRMDVAGPPPLDKDKIKEIPSVVITQEQAAAKLQCSVCLEDFQVGESVRKLQCGHFYHSPCILPWLELHGTCPICRKSLSGVSDENGCRSSASPSTSSTSTTSTSTVQRIRRRRGRGLTNLPWNSDRWMSASPPTSSTSTNTSSRGRRGRRGRRRRRDQPPSESEMGFEFD